MSKPLLLNGVYCRVDRGSTRNVLLRITIIKRPASAGLFLKTMKFLILLLILACSGCSFCHRVGPAFAAGLSGAAGNGVNSYQIGQIQRQQQINTFKVNYK